MMKNSDDSLSDLRKRVLQLLLMRLLIPMLLFTFIIVTGAGYLGVKNLESQQRIAAESLSQMTERYLDQGIRIIDAVAAVSKDVSDEQLHRYLSGIWGSYKYFETIYILDDLYHVKDLIPYDRNIIGLDLSNIPSIAMNSDADSVVISKPFISLRTGEPTVYLIKKINDGGMAVGELNLSILQKEIQKEQVKQPDSIVYIMDQTGTLLAHPDINQVREQMNLSNLEIFQESKVADATLLYTDSHSVFLGSATMVKSVGWVVVSQLPVLVLFAPFIIALLGTMAVFFLIWLGVFNNLRKSLHGSVVEPLFQQYSMENMERMKAEEIKDEANRANLAKSAFLANMSHELRTPLNAILGFSELLSQDSSIPETAKENLRIINRSGEHLLTLINDVLDLSKIETGHLELNPTTIDVNLTIRWLQELFQVKADKKGIQLNIEITDDVPPFIIADEKKLRQVLINLMGNAFKFTEAGSVTLRLERVNDPKETECVLRFLVKDSGYGIAPDEQSELFNEYVQGHRGHHAEDSTGLGLAIADRYVKLMGGEIQLVSKLGAGSTFFFEIPVEVLVHPTTEAEYPQTSGSAILNILPTEMLIALAEASSNLDTTEVMLLIQQARSYNVPLADELSTLAAEFKYDVIHDQCNDALNVLKTEDSP